MHAWVWAETWNKVWAQTWNKADVSPRGPVATYTRGILTEPNSYQGSLHACLGFVPLAVACQCSHAWVIRCLTCVCMPGQGHFRGVFPVKCNHDKDLIAAILDDGRQHAFGLEAGSKAELLLAMSMLSKYPGSLLLCNGYKDAEYMQLVRRLGCSMGFSFAQLIDQIWEALADLLAESKDCIAVHVACSCLMPRRGTRNCGCI